MRCSLLLCSFSATQTLSDLGLDRVWQREKKQLHEPPPNSDKGRVETEGPKRVEGSSLTFCYTFRALRDPPSAPRDLRRAD